MNKTLIIVLSILLLFISFFLGRHTKTVYQKIERCDKGYRELWMDSARNACGGSGIKNFKIDRKNDPEFECK